MNPVGSRRVYFVNAKLKVQNEKCKIKVVAEGDFQNFKFWFLNFKFSEQSERLTP